jgi:N6-adenosine-specific RNA methylase IME4
MNAEVHPLLPAGPFDLIYADPPWQYEAATATPNRRIERQYVTMTLADICALPIAELVAPDAMLYLWAPPAKVPEALQVVTAWGFVYRTHAVWDKGSIGPGYWFRCQHEDLLVARRGKFPVPAPSLRSSGVIRAPRRAHSAKPDVVYERLEAMHPGACRLELFARGLSRPGWTAWGNEVTDVAVAS